MALTGYQVIGECNNGKEFMTLLKSMEVRILLLLDINMPEMDGHETAIWLNKEHPANQRNCAFNVR